MIVQCFAVVPDAGETLSHHYDKGCSLGDADWLENRANSANINCQLICHSSLGVSLPDTLHTPMMNGHIFILLLG